MSLWFSQLELARSSSVQALAGVLLPEDGGQRRAAHHNLMWSVFSDGPDRDRDFLWREEGEGRFLTLSSRPPQKSDLFGLSRSQEFAPNLSVGDRLAFKLRANATRTKRDGKRVDVVMDALFGLPKEDRAARRMELATQEGKAWLARQGGQAGFNVINALAEDYRTETLPRHRGPKKDQPQFGILDLSGVIEITNPAAFLAQLPVGFGRAKAFGCGMMLVKRAA